MYLLSMVINHYIQKKKDTNYVLVITRPGGMSLIYKHDARGREAPGGGVLINQIHPDWACQK